MDKHRTVVVFNSIKQVVNKTNVVASVVLFRLTVVLTENIGLVIVIEGKKELITVSINYMDVNGKNNEIVPSLC